MVRCHSTEYKRMARLKTIFGLLIILVAIFLLFEAFAVNEWVITRRNAEGLGSRECTCPESNVQARAFPGSTEKNETNNELPLSEEKPLVPSGDSMKERFHHLKQACANHTNTYGIISKQQATKDNLVHYPNQNLIFCQIYKAGSSTINRVLDYMSRYNRFKSPFLISWNDLVKNRKHPPIKDIFSRNDTLLNKSMKVLFVRNPYYRIFSGYMDKLFFPNMYYWKGLGIPIVKTLRHNASKLSLTCGHDLSFSEVIRYVLTGMKSQKSFKLDVHFAPMHESCQPCKIEYDVIGKMETFENDLQLVWDMAKKYGGVNLTFPDVKAPSDTENLEDKTKMIFGSQKHYGKCMKFYDVLKRAWRAFQIRGKLGRNITMPITEAESATISREKFIEKVRQAYRDSGSREYLSQTKTEALLEAYRTVPMKDLLELKTLLQPDCNLYNYDCTPDFIFKRSGIASNTSKYFDIL